MFQKMKRQLITTLNFTGTWRVIKYARLKKTKGFLNKAVEWIQSLAQQIEVERQYYRNVSEGVLKKCLLGFPELNGTRITNQRFSKQLLLAVKLHETYLSIFESDARWFQEISSGNHKIEWKRKDFQYTRTY